MAQRYNEVYQCHYCKVGIVERSLAEYQQKMQWHLCCSARPCLTKRDIARGLICCERATTFQCVCESAYSCPDHAPDGKHVGSHS